MSKTKADRKVYALFGRHCLHVTYNRVSRPQHRLKYQVDTFGFFAWCLYSLEVFRLRRRRKRLQGKAGKAKPERRATKRLQGLARYCCSYPRESHQAKEQESMLPQSLRASFMRAPEMATSALCVLVIKQQKWYCFPLTAHPILRNPSTSD